VCVCGAGLYRSQERPRGHFSRENVFKIDDVTLEGDAMQLD
jgi:hypothetical protein